MSGYEAHLANQEERINRKHQVESLIEEVKDSIIEASRHALDVPVEAMNNINVILALGVELVALEAERDSL